MEGQPQNPEFLINPENFHPCLHVSVQKDSVIELSYIPWASTQENLSLVFAHNKCADQTVQSDQRLCYLLI